MLDILKVWYLLPKVCLTDAVVYYTDTPINSAVWALPRRAAGDGPPRVQQLHQQSCLQSTVLPSPSFLYTIFLQGSDHHCLKSVF